MSEIPALHNQPGISVVITGNNNISSETYKLHVCYKHGDVVVYCTMISVFGQGHGIVLYTNHINADTATQSDLHQFIRTSFEILEQN